MRNRVETLDRQKHFNFNVGGLWTSVWRWASTFVDVFVWVVCGEVIGEGRQREKGNDNDSRGSSLNKY